MTMLPTDDAARLEAIRDSGLLDADLGEAMDRLARLARRVVGVETALVSLVETERQVFAGQAGLREPVASSRETPISHSFCRHVVAREDPLVVRDARTHPLVCNNPAIDAHDVTAYLGVPLSMPGGQVIGSLCAISSEPRDWTDEDVAALTDLAAFVTNEIALRDALEQRVQAEEGRQLVVDELNHRVRNLFTLFQGLVRDQKAGGPEVAAFQKTLSRRIEALAEAHRAVFEHTLEGDALGERADFAAVARAVLRAVPARDRIDRSGPPVAMRSQQALFAALLLHELATNALKHGALSVPDGRVSLSWSAGDDEVRIDWIEHGAPPADPPKTQGFGSRLIDIVTAGARRDDAGITREPGGYAIRLGLPLA